MDITTLLQAEKIRKYLVLLFVILFILIVFFTVQRIFSALSSRSVPEEMFQYEPKELKINLDVLENPLLKGLQPFKNIEPFRGIMVNGAVIKEVGRSNPFKPY